MSKSGLSMFSGQAQHQEQTEPLQERKSKKRPISRDRLIKKLNSKLMQPLISCQNASKEHQEQLTEIDTRLLDHKKRAARVAKL
jgi:hypothetical protein